MAAATLRPQMTAATGHGQEVLLLHSTAMSANVVFINIDWKASRHNKTLEANMKLLGLTIAGVVRNMKPAMVCMCEVGEASNPLTKEQMQQVADRSMQAWRDAATDVQLHCMFEVGAPYMTIYIHGSVQCSCHRILEGLLQCTRATTHSANVPVLWSRWCHCRRDQCPCAIRQQEAH